MVPNDKDYQLHTYRDLPIELIRASRALVFDPSVGLGGVKVATADEILTVRLTDPQVRNRFSNNHLVLYSIGAFFQCTVRDISGFQSPASGLFMVDVTVEPDAATQTDVDLTRRGVPLQTTFTSVPVGAGFYVTMFWIAAGTPLLVPSGYEVRAIGMAATGAACGPGVGSTARITGVGNIEPNI